jgi:hypothetical protein
VPGNTLRMELAQFFGAPNWPSTVDRVGQAVVLGMGGLLALGVMFNRRRAGLAHCGRALLALAGVGAALVTLNAAVIGVEWQTVASMLDQGLVGPAINDLFAHVNEGRFVIAGVLMVASLTVLAWPPQARTGRDDADDVDVRQAGGVA